MCIKNHNLVMQYDLLLQLRPVLELDMHTHATKMFPASDRDVQGLLAAIEVLCGLSRR